MSERRSGRSRKQVDYAKFATDMDNDDDFADTTPPPPKKQGPGTPNASRARNLFDDFADATPPPPKKQKSAGKAEVKEDKKTAKPPPNDRAKGRPVRVPLDEKLYARDLEAALALSMGPSQFERTVQQSQAVLHSTPLPGARQASHTTELPFQSQPCLPSAIPPSTHSAKAVAVDDDIEFLGSVTCNDPESPRPRQLSTAGKRTAVVDCDAEYSDSSDGGEESSDSDSGSDFEEEEDSDFEDSRTKNKSKGKGKTSVSSKKDSDAATRKTGTARQTQRASAAQPSVKSASAAPGSKSSAATSSRSGSAAAEATDVRVPQSSTITAPSSAGVGVRRPTARTAAAATPTSVTNAAAVTPASVTTAAAVTPTSGRAAAATTPSAGVGRAASAVRKAPAWTPPSHSGGQAGDAALKSPSSGLRLGLSRHARLKPLHPSLKVS